MLYYFITCASGIEAIAERRCSTIGSLSYIQVITW